jgi:hypothetical protein
MLKSPNNYSLVFKTGYNTLRNTNNTIYTYRTIDQTTTTSHTLGTLVKTIGSTGETYPYTYPNLSDADLRTLYVVPISNSLTAFTALGGTVSSATNSPTLTGSGTNFNSDLAAGDYIKISGSAGQGNNVKKIVSVTNSTSLTLDSNCSFANTSAVYRRVFPQNAPIPFGSRSGLSANISVDGKTLTLNYGMLFESGPVIQARGAWVFLTFSVCAMFMWEIAQSMSTQRTLYQSFTWMPSKILITWTCPTFIRYPKVALL